MEDQVRKKLSPMIKEKYLFGAQCIPHKDSTLAAKDNHQPVLWKRLSAWIDPFQ